ncbi:MAG: hypothetical protein HY453_00260 [Parcubacteria group bacterium]|nr:hypothetical protein [Parcubacteria group bacterium]
MQTTFLKVIFFITLALSTAVVLENMKNNSPETDRNVAGTEPVQKVEESKTPAEIAQTPPDTASPTTGASTTQPDPEKKEETAPKTQAEVKKPIKTTSPIPTRETVTEITRISDKLIGDIAFSAEEKKLLDMSTWKKFTHPDWHYSLMIPPFLEIKESDSSDITSWRDPQKRISLFIWYLPDGYGPSFDTLSYSFEWDAEKNFIFKNKKRYIYPINQEPPVDYVSYGAYMSVDKKRGATIDISAGVKDDSKFYQKIFEQIAFSFQLKTDLRDVREVP